MRVPRSTVWHSGCCCIRTSRSVYRIQHSSRCPNACAARCQGGHQCVLVAHMAASASASCCSTPWMQQSVEGHSHNTAGQPYGAIRGERVTECKSSKNCWVVTHQGGCRVLHCSSAYRDSHDPQVDSLWAATLHAQTEVSRLSNLQFG